MSELKDISGASSSNPVNVLTHTMSEVSHRLTTASEALDAKYLYTKDNVVGGQAYPVGCTLLAAARHQQQSNACQQAAIESCSLRECNQAVQSKVMQRSTAKLVPAAWVKAQVVDMRRLAMTNHGLKVLERRILEHLRVLACSVTLPMHYLIASGSATSMIKEVPTSMAPPWIARYISFPSLLHNTSFTCLVALDYSDACVTQLLLSASSAVQSAMHYELGAPVSRTCASGPP